MNKTVAKYNCVTSKDRTANNIIQMILNGQIKGGQQIKQADIAKQNHVSLSTVRDALTTLEKKGYIELISGQGAFCRIYTIACFEKLMQIRRELEVLSAKLAAENADINQLDELKQIAERLNYLVENNKDEEKINEEHINFHVFIAKISQNQYLEKVIVENHISSEIIDVMTKFFEKKGIVQKDYTKSYANHLNLAEIIASRNIEKIDEAMRSHLTIIINDEFMEKYRDTPVF